jgi:16S rRNA (adenine1518-N6/adenine1519-N6)-dimethyltransferase
MKEFEIYEKLVLMFQKEVADRLCAVPSTKDYGRLSVLVQLKSDIEKVFDIEPGSFFPPPKVKSTVVKITPKNYSLNDDTLDDTSKDTLNSTLNDTFSDLLKEMFAHKRKRVVKSLSLFFEKPEQILLEWGYGPNVRAEEITVKDYAKLAEHLFENKKEMKKNENNYV